MNVTQFAAIVAIITTVGGGAWVIDDRYAKIEQVGANSQQIAIIKIENAASSKNWPLLRRLCDDFRQTHGWTPSACKNR